MMKRVRNRGDVGTLRRVSWRGARVPALLLGAVVFFAAGLYGCGGSADFCSYSIEQMPDDTNCRDAAVDLVCGDFAFDMETNVCDIQMCVCVANDNVCGNLTFPPPSCPPTPTVVPQA